MTAANMGKRVSRNGGGVRLVVVEEVVKMVVGRLEGGEVMMK